MTPTAGLQGRAELVVTNADTAVALGSGDVEVFATPMVLALVEAATVDAVAGTLAPNETSVGVHAELDHVAPALVGATVQARATLEEVAGRRLRFAVTAHDGDTLIASGVVVRVVVDRDRFGSR